MLIVDSEFRRKLSRSDFFLAKAPGKSSKRVNRSLAPSSNRPSALLVSSKPPCFNSPVAGWFDLGWFDLGWFDLIF
jgi:hypothetical protein